MDQGGVERQLGLQDVRFELFAAEIPGPPFSSFRCFLPCLVVSESHSVIMGGLATLGMRGNC